jgi:hypothetical protein
MTPVTARRARVEILLFTFIGLVRGPRMDCDRTTGRSALLKGKPSHVEPSFGATSLTQLFSLEQPIAQAFLVPPPTKDGGSLG